MPTAPSTTPRAVARRLLKSMGVGVILIGIVATAGCAVRDDADGDTAPNSSASPAPTGQGAEGTDEQSQGNTAPTPGSDATNAEAFLAIAELGADDTIVTLSGYVIGIVEEGGSCTFTMTPTSGEPVVMSRDAMPDRSTTSCGGVEFEVESALHSGTWSATVTYTPAGENTTPVTSTPESIDIP